jgi:type IV secretory pathway TraG/TraD family ATPase VirD4
VNPREIPLLTAQEVKQLEDEDVIVFHRNLAPIIARRMDWRRIPLLQKRVRLAPPALSPLAKPKEAIIRT